MGYMAFVKRLPRTWGASILYTRWPTKCQLDSPPL